VTRASTSSSTGAMKPICPARRGGKSKASRARHRRCRTKCRRTWCVPASSRPRRGAGNARWAAVPAFRPKAPGAPPVRFPSLLPSPLAQACPPLSRSV
jgi:hypothetical protein